MSSIFNRKQQISEEEEPQVDLHQQLLQPPIVSPRKVQPKTFTVFENVKEMCILLPVSEWLRLVQGNTCGQLSNSAGGHYENDRRGNCRIREHIERGRIVYKHGKIEVPKKGDAVKNKKERLLEAMKAIKQVK